MTAPFDEYLLRLWYRCRLPTILLGLNPDPNSNFSSGSACLREYLGTLLIWVPCLSDSEALFQKREWLSCVSCLSCLSDKDQEQLRCVVVTLVEVSEIEFNFKEEIFFFFLCFYDRFLFTLGLFFLGFHERAAPWWTRIINSQENFCFSNLNFCFIFVLFLFWLILIIFKWTIGVEYIVCKFN